MNNECKKKINIYIDYWKDMLKKCRGKSITLTCTPLKPDVHMSNKCKNSKKINIYIEYLKWYVKKHISKSIMFACMSLTCVLIK